MSIFSVVLLRNLVAKFASKDLVLGLSKDLLMAALLSKLCID